MTVFVVAYKLQIFLLTLFYIIIYIKADVFKWFVIRVQIINVRKCETRFPKLNIDV